MFKSFFPHHKAVVTEGEGGGRWSRSREHTAQVWMLGWREGVEERKRETGGEAEGRATGGEGRKSGRGGGPKKQEWISRISSHSAQVIARCQAPAEEL